MKAKVKGEVWEWFKAIAVGFLLFLVIRMFFFSSYIVEGASMMPTLEDGNKLIVNKIGYHIGDIDRFDVIVFHANSKENFVKRVIGLPGDKIEYKQDKLFINGKYMTEKYLNAYKGDLVGNELLTGDFTLKELTGKTTVPKDKLFVMGDNRHGSYDSRHIGYVAIDSVVGKVDIRYWPITEIATGF